MATCPRCGGSSRTDPTLMTLEPVFGADSASSFSLSGAQVKVSARSAMRLTCRCGWSVVGQIVDGQLVVAPRGEKDVGR
jgi:hypothetical protein